MVDSSECFRKPFSMPKEWFKWVYFVKMKLKVKEKELDWQVTPPLSTISKNARYKVPFSWRDIPLAIPSTKGYTRFWQSPKKKIPAQQNLSEKTFLQAFQLVGSC